MPKIEEQNDFVDVEIYRFETKNVEEGEGEGVNVGVNEIYTFIKENQPTKANEISKKYNQVTKRTIERWLKQLKNENKIEFRGSPKTGGYFVI